MDPINPDIDNRPKHKKISDSMSLYIRALGSSLLFFSKKHTLTLYFIHAFVLISLMIFRNNVVVPYASIGTKFILFIVIIFSVCVSWFLSNSFDITAEEIAQLYKYRWKVELFFKWIKQHLKVKSFWGTSLNAVKIQVFQYV